MTERVQVVNGEIRIKSPKNRSLALFYPFWLIMLPVWLVSSIWLLESKPAAQSGFLLFFVPVASICWALTLLGYLWFLFGNEVISQENGFLLVKRSLFGYGLTKRFSLSKVLNLRVSTFFPQTMTWSLTLARLGMGGGTVTFEYEGKTQRMGIDLPERESGELAQLMKQKFNLG
jgi:hypothetical protein